MHIIWTPTQFCPAYAGRHCRYCGYLDSSRERFEYMDMAGYDIGPEPEPAEWARIFAGEPAAQISATGGEPLAYDGLAAVVRACPQHRFSFTTNLLYDPSEVAALPNVTGWSASYHYLMPGKMRERFWTNVEKLRGRVRVTLVAYPDAWPQFLVALGEVEAARLPLIVHPFYAPDKTFPAGLLDELRALGHARVEGMETWRGESSVRRCSAGTDYAAYGPDGKRWRCYTYQHLGREHDGGDRCETACLFPCDWRFPTQEAL